MVDEVYLNVVPNDFYNSYKPDIVVIDKISNLHLDIEIDEPYDYSNYEPIHYLEGGDDHRDYFFYSRNWVVIRFTEKQICTSPEDCYLLIKSVIDSIVNINTHKNSLTKEKRWTKQEAFKMAKSKYRNTYLFNNGFSIF